MLRIKIGNFEIELAGDAILLGILGIVGAVLIAIFGK